MCLYIDNILIVGSDNNMIKSTKDMFNSRFDMKDIGLAYVISGIKFSSTLDGFKQNS